MTTATNGAKRRGRPPKSALVSAAANAGDQRAVAPRKSSVGNAAADPFRHKLVLNAWLVGQFGVDALAEHKDASGRAMPAIRKLAAPLLDESKEGLHADGRHRFFHELAANWDAAAPVSLTDLERYEDNLLACTQALNNARAARGLQPIAWKYYQWLSLLFAERYLDLYFHRPLELLDGLNAFVPGFNAWRAAQHLPGAMEPYTLDQLNKLCLQNATGSGKTLLMHANVLQFRHYVAAAGRAHEFSRTVLVTPNESLTEQHLRELEQDGLRAQRFRADLLGMPELSRVDVIEVTKLGEVRKENTVAVAEFGDNNLLLVDEGHRGLGSEEETGWLRRRQAIAERGFVFEYSATFAQAVAAAGIESITQAYAKGVLFDYSYRYFYEDGFGKDYSILNLAKEDATVSRRYLTACLLAYFQQLQLYDRDTLQLRPFNLEKPLWVFVGGSVSKASGGTRDEQASVSDVARIVQFLGDFLADPATSKADIRRLLTEKGEVTGLLDDNGVDIFRGAFPVLGELYAAGTGEDELFARILAEVFNARSSGRLRITRIKGDSGEIHLRVGQADKPFGLINVGDAKGLADHIRKELPGDKIEIADSEFDEQPLFAGASGSGSPVNVLIGAKKFIEGWDCWRVSTLGLMHVGKSEGAQIIQLFGRGVRLKGFGWSLKRSARCTRVNVTRPKHIEWLETLQVFGIEAEFMQRFRDYLESEGLPGNERKETIELPMQVTRDFGKRLKVLRPKIKRDDGKEYDFKLDAPLPVLALPLPRKLQRRPVQLDWYPRIEAASSRTRSAEDGGEKLRQTLGSAQLALIDWDGVFFEIEAYKRARGWENLLVRRTDLPRLFEAGHNGWYCLLAPEAVLQPTSWSGVRQWQSIAVALLKKLAESFVNFHVDAFFERRLEYRVLTPDDDNLPGPHESWKLIVDATRETLIDDLRRLQHDVQLLADSMAAVGTVCPLRDEPSAFPSQDPRALLGGMHLYSPLLHMPDSALAASSIRVLPVALKDSEFNFVKDLHAHLDVHAADYAGCEFFLLRNKSRGKGIGFFEAGGFYPDFLLWILKDGRQHIAFVEPHGLRHETKESDKVRFHETVKDIERRLGDVSVQLTSYVLSPTPMGQLTWGLSTLDEFAAIHVLLMHDDKEGYIGRLLHGTLNAV